MKKSRLDHLVLELGLFETRQAAQTAIMDGAVLVNGQKVTKPGMNFSADAKIELVSSFETAKYVSRGGLKLEKALDEFAIQLQNRVCLDVGASTGGFTDCMLQRGAAKVYAVDVGYGQIDWKLRQDQRVVVLERINARYLTSEQLYGSSAEWATFFVADVSFISLSKIFPAVAQLMMPNASDAVCLIKPQFEVGREHVEKGGVVKSEAAHIKAIEAVIASAKNSGLHARGLTFSPITGPAGNIEYLVHLCNVDASGENSSYSIDVARIVEDAIAALRK